MIMFTKMAEYVSRVLWCYKNDMRPILIWRETREDARRLGAVIVAMACLFGIILIDVFHLIFRQPIRLISIPFVAAVYHVRVDVIRERAKGHHYKQMHLGSGVAPYEHHTH